MGTNCFHGMFYPIEWKLVTPLGSNTVSTIRDCGPQLLCVSCNNGRCCDGSKYANRPSPIQSIESKIASLPSVWIVFVPESPSIGVEGSDTCRPASCSPRTVDWISDKSAPTRKTSQYGFNFVLTTGRVLLLFPSGYNDDDDKLGDDVLVAAVVAEATDEEASFVAVGVAAGVVVDPPVCWRIECFNSSRDTSESISIYLFRSINPFNRYGLPSIPAPRFTTTGFILGVILVLELFVLLLVSSS
jgi:hypothetical protein